MQGAVLPEGPELATARDELRRLIVGQKLIDLCVGVSGRYKDRPPVGLDCFNDKRSTLGNPTISQVETHGKFMWWKFAFTGGDSWYVHCTYGMAGGWHISPSKHTAFIVEYTQGGKLYFNDPRHFGTLKFISDQKEHDKKLASLGPDLLNARVTPEIFAKNILRKPTRTIAEAIMDQSTVSGVGNYAKAEILFRSGISPWRVVTDITPSEYVKLCTEAASVLNESYRSQGATIKTYKNVDGSIGKSQFSFRVYARDLCPSGHLVKREVTPEGRTSHWCPICQI
ncbi:MAG: Fpg/Nei family DNA glycosylase [Caulobacteraceae bacterium]|nr:Fpg/Nei family DNA glycosylase [Caulobacteraceae bacterium]